MGVAFCSDEDCFFASDLWIVAFEMSAKSQTADSCSLCGNLNWGSRDFLLFSDRQLCPSHCFSRLMSDISHAASCEWGSPQSGMEAWVVLESLLGEGAGPAEAAQGVHRF